MLLDVNGGSDVGSEGTLTTDVGAEVSNIVGVKSGCTIVFQPMALRYRTSIIPASPKKLFACARQLKGLGLNAAISLCKLSPKRSAFCIGKSLCTIRHNMINIRNISNECVRSIFITKVVIEKRNKFYGYRYRAKGAMSRSVKLVCSLNIYFKKLS